MRHPTHTQATHTCMVRITGDPESNDRHPNSNVPTRVGPWVEEIVATVWNGARQRALRASKGIRAEVVAVSICR